MDFSSGDIHDHTKEPSLRLIVLGWCLWIRMPWFFDFSAYYMVPVHDPMDDTVAYHYQDFRVRTFRFKLCKSYWNLAYGAQTMDCNMNYIQRRWKWDIVRCIRERYYTEGGWVEGAPDWHLTDKLYEQVQEGTAGRVTTQYALMRMDNGKTYHGRVFYLEQEYIRGSRLWSLVLFKKSWKNARMSCAVFDMTDAKADRHFLLSDIETNHEMDDTAISLHAYRVYKSQGFYAIRN